MTRSSLLFTRSANPVLDAPIRAWDADHSGHVGIRIMDKVIDATLWHGVAVWPLADWLQRRVLVDDLPVIPRSLGQQQTAEMRLFDRIGQRYDFWEIAGFLLLRDLGDPQRPICSRLAIDYLTDACSVSLPGKQGRVGPRLVRATLHAYNAGLKNGEPLPVPPMG
jgi:hypothetical protein